MASNVMHEDIHIISKFKGKMLELRNRGIALSSAVREVY